MRKIVKEDLLSFQEYNKVREKFLKSVIDEKKIRRISLNDRMSGLFETRLSVWFQIQEMIRAEQIVQPEYIKEMLDVYNALIPNNLELSMTLFIEISGKQELRSFNRTIVGIENFVFLQFGEDQVKSYEPDSDDSEYTQSVHYLRLPFSHEQLRNFVLYEGEVKLRIDHPNFCSEVILDPVLVTSLKNELENAKVS